MNQPQGASPRLFSDVSRLEPGASALRLIKSTDRELAGVEVEQSN